MFNNKNFYPTPTKLIEKMLSKIDFTKAKYFLEPSAGKGDIVDTIINYGKHNGSYIKERFADCIEIDTNLQHIIKGKGYRLVHNDFLTFNSYKKYDAVVMNPPFDHGDKHLLKAIELIKSFGGQIVCLLNAETFLNPFSNSRKELIEQLDKCNADIEIIEDGFIDAERKTNVKTALVNIVIEKSYNKDNSILYNNMQKKEYENIKQKVNNSIIDNDFLKAIVLQYELEALAGMNFIQEYYNIKNQFNYSFEENSASLIDLKINGKSDDKGLSLEHAFINQLRTKYWNCLFTNQEFTKRFTSELTNKYHNMIDELVNYDFSYYNIITIKNEMNQEILSSIHEAIIKCFDSLTHKYSYSEECKKNIHLYNGWKTNKSFKINSKIILPKMVFDTTWNKFRFDWSLIQELEDIEKIFNFLDNNQQLNKKISDILRDVENTQGIKNINTKYFSIDCFKKGTIHLKFKNLELLEKFNIYAGKHYNWLPSSFGKKKYKEANIEEQKTIDSYMDNNKERYNNIVNNPNIYLLDRQLLLS